MDKIRKFIYNHSWFVAAIEWLIVIHLTNVYLEKTGVGECRLGLMNVYFVLGMFSVLFIFEFLNKVIVGKSR